MGYSGKLEEKQIARRLRKQGWSYRRILTQVPVSKDSISRWCRDIYLTAGQKKLLLQNKQFGQRKGSIIAAENRRKERLLRAEQIFKQAKKILGRLSARDRFIAGLALYAAEGQKTDGKGGFANSDPSLIKFMVNWFVKNAKVSPNKLRGAIWIHDDLDERRAKKFWSRLTHIPLGYFYKTYVVPLKRDSRKIRKNIHPYGVFSINFCDSNKQRQIIGWIKAAFGDKIEAEK